MRRSKLLALILSSSMVLSSVAGMSCLAAGAADAADETVEEEIELEDPGFLENLDLSEEAIGDQFGYTCAIISEDDQVVMSAAYDGDNSYYGFSTSTAALEAYYVDGTLYFHVVQAAQDEEMDYVILEITTTWTDGEDYDFTLTAYADEDGNEIIIYDENAPADLTAEDTIWGIDMESSSFVNTENEETVPFEYELLDTNLYDETGIEDTEAETEEETVEETEEEEAEDETEEEAEDDSDITEFYAISVDPEPETYVEDTCTMEWTDGETYEFYIYEYQDGTLDFAWLPDEMYEEDNPWTFDAEKCAFVNSETEEEIAVELVDSQEYNANWTNADIMDIFDMLTYSGALLIENALSDELSYEYIGEYASIGEETYFAYQTTAELSLDDVSVMEDSEYIEEAEEEVISEDNIPEAEEEETEEETEEEIEEVLPEEVLYTLMFTEDGQLAMIEIDAETEIGIISFVYGEAIEVPEEFDGAIEISPEDVLTSLYS